MRAAPLVLLLLLAPAAAASPLVEVGDVPVEVKGAPMTFVTVEVPVRSVASEAVVVTLGVADLPKYDDSVVVVPEQLRLDPGESEPVMVTFLTPHHDGYVNRTDYYVLQVRARPLAQPDAEP
ncbi:MAG TPA: hypothetical protein VHH36_02495, partial [Candidatus Thermoplasmatota archaeon]|nr:hypothetical protein [Candidatus Thermoplasmatota archaeon]